MAKEFTPEEREEVKARIVEFVRLSGRETFRQLADKTGVSKTAIRRLSGALAASGDVWLSGCGVFPSEQAYRVWRKTPEKAADPCNQVNHLIPTRVLVKGGEITCKILK